jgi:hypothetical protein
MNALSEIFEFASAPQRNAIVDAALGFRGTPGASDPDRSKCWDSVAFMTTLTGVDIPPSWRDEGGRLPFDMISFFKARPGDLLVFYAGDLTNYRNSYFAGVFTEGLNTDDRRARFIMCGPIGGTRVYWLDAWRQYLVGTYRLPQPLNS